MKVHANAATVRLRSRRITTIPRRLSRKSVDNQIALLRSRTPVTRSTSVLVCAEVLLVRRFACRALSPTALKHTIRRTLATSNWCYSMGRPTMISAQFATQCVLVNKHRCASLADIYSTWSALWRSFRIGGCHPGLYLDSRCAPHARKIRSMHLMWTV